MNLRKHAHRQHFFVCNSVVDRNSIFGDEHGEIESFFVGCGVCVELVV